MSGHTPSTMLVTATRFLQLYLGSLVVGTMFAVWVGYDPRGLTYATFVEQHQNAVSGLNTLIPALGALLILLTLLLVYLLREQSGQRWPLLAGALCFVGAGLATRLGCQPINALVDTWTTEDPPSDWQALRADWWHYHLLRLGSGAIGFALVLWAALRSRTR